MANPISIANAKARETIQAVVAWLDLGIFVIERVSLLGLAILLFGAVDAKFNIANLAIPSVEPWALVGLCIVQAVISGRVRFEKAFEFLTSSK